MLRHSQHHVREELHRLDVLEVVVCAGRVRVGEHRGVARTLTRLLLLVLALHRRVPVVLDSIIRPENKRNVL